MNLFLKQARSRLWTEPKAAKLQALREKAAHVKSGAKPAPGASMQSFKAKDSFAGSKKTSFQRKAV